MNWKKVTGACLIGLPFLALAVYLISIDWYVFFLVFGGTAIIVAMIELGVKLISED